MSERFEQRRPRPRRRRRRRSRLLAGLRRRRWQFAPPVVGAVAQLAAVLVETMPQVVVLAAAGAAAWARWRLPRSGLRREEVLYARVIVGTAVVWAFLVGWLRPPGEPLLVAWLVLVVGFGMPWWRHRAVRGRVRVEKLVGAWPDWAERAGLGGVQVVSGTAGPMSDRIRLEVLRGRQSADQLGAQLWALAQVRGIPVHRLRIDDTITRRDPGLVDLLVTHTDPWRDDAGVPVSISHPAVADPMAWAHERASVCDPVPFGVTEDGMVASVRLRNEAGGRIVVLAAKKGSGKSVTINDLLAGLVRCDDVDLVVINCKEGGKSTRRWEPALVVHATTPAQADWAMRWVVAETGRRGAESPDPVLRPTRRRRALVVVIDEYGTLALRAPKVADLVEDYGRTLRSASCSLVLADQRPDSTAWSGVLRGQIDEVLCGRMENRRDAKSVFPAYREVDVTQFDPEMGGLLAHYRGPGLSVSLSRSWRLEEPSDIDLVVAECLSVRGVAGGVSRVDVAVPAGVAVAGDSGTVGVAMSPGAVGSDGPSPGRGEGGPVARLKINSALSQIAADAARRGEAEDLAAGEVAAIGQTHRPSAVTGDGGFAAGASIAELTLDYRIIELIKAAEPNGLAMSELVNATGEPRSTVQARCSAMARQANPAVHPRPRRGRHVRWYLGTPSVTVSTPEVNA